MTTIRLLSLLLTLSLSLSLLAQKTNPAADRPLELTQTHAPEVMPLRLKEPKLITGLKLYARSHQVLELALVNTPHHPHLPLPEGAGQPVARHSRPTGRTPHPHPHRRTPHQAWPLQQNALCQAQG